MPTDIRFKALNTAHRAVIAITRGRLGTRFFGMPTLVLTTVGRKSGRPHRVVLTAPVTDGDAMIVVASRGGDPVDPAWLHNLRAEPSVRVSFRNGPTRPMTARELPRGERDRLWPRVVEAQSGYADYQDKTTRVIPLVMLTPGHAAGNSVDRSSPGSGRRGHR
ncbi:nitroreductase/quinone reductase family protein [Nocardia bovistercoris]|uniref:Nitroreductase family deazaflavin-dependent oxidoreductase n=1 Tax=Nocardia bovistercoris TaxID=2785916 RepID=A0A931IER8_9NOCA|nr:nitroreductase/quinone reductase family protein [Nocardia bovistercoris]MBH0779891.1 nitroreductase family deazaflavin-dependent oxidoreductase [Nocardia bovistercoris]